jgi:hypothetical protein
VGDEQFPINEVHIRFHGNESVFLRFFQRTLVYVIIVRMRVEMWRLVLGKRRQTYRKDQNVLEHSRVFKSKDNESRRASYLLRYFSAMRKGLAAQQGARKKFKAVFSKIGKKKNFNGYSEDTILLARITDVETNTVVADHVWFTYTVSFEKAFLKEGDSLEFEARVKEYRKGYVNRELKINQRTTDFKLSHPTKIRKVEGW